jgi:hypothetical protein
MMSAPSRCIWVMALMLTCRLVLGQTPAVGLLEQQFKRADSAVSILLECPETRMKEIAPVEDLFREWLAKRPEFVTVLRTNSKGLIVNIMSRGDSAYGKNTDVSSKEWYGGPQESRRPYYGPVIQENRKSFLFWSKPILVRNSLGMSRFGGVIAAKVNLPVCFKLFAARFQEPFQILLKGKEFYYLSWDEHARYEEKTVRIPGVAGLTVRFIEKKEIPQAMPTHFDSTAASKIIANKTIEKKDASAGAVTGIVSASSLSVRNGTPTEKRAAALKTGSAHNVMKKNIGQGLAGTIVIVAVFIMGLSMSRGLKKKKTLKEETPADSAAGSGLAKELDDAIRKSLDNEPQENILTQEAETVRVRLREEMNAKIRQELVEQEYGVLKDNRRDELKKRIHDEIIEKELPGIRDDILRRVSEEEHSRINEQERPGIIEAERNRLRERESPGLREEIRAKLREEEIEAVHERVKTEIYAETVQALKAGLEEKYRDAVEKKLEEFTSGLEKRLRAEIKGRIKSEYRNLMERIEQLSHDMGNVEALDSLSQTITLLLDEKKKYKYFNLNTAQTESLLEYLKRVRDRFNIFLDKHDEEVREMALKVNSIMNALDNSDSG